MSILREGRMFGVVLALHLLVCLGLVGVILIQSGKGGGLSGGAFGGATQTVFGGRGAVDFITRATIGLGVAFFVTSMTLALMTAGSSGPSRGKSLLQSEARKAAQRAPQQQQGAPAPIGTPAPGGAPTPAGGTR
jgi:preprotein translocase subunit SecG